MDLTDFFKELKGESRPTLFDCIIAVTRDGDAYLIECKQEVLFEIFDGCDLEDNLTNTNNMPKEAGIYDCTISYHSFPSHHPEDPVEYDANCFIVTWTKSKI